MRRTRAANNSDTLPTITGSEAPGYYKNRDGLTPGTTIDASELNILQEEVAALAEMGDDALDATGADRTQAADAMKARFGALDSGAASVAGDNIRTRALLASTGGYVEGDQSAAIASDRAIVSGENSAVVASRHTVPAVSSIGAAAACALVAASKDSAIANQALAQVAVLASDAASVAGPTGSNVAVMACEDVAINGDCEDVALIATYLCNAAVAVKSASVASSSTAMDTVTDSAVMASVDVTVQDAHEVAVIACDTADTAGATRTLIAASYDCYTTENVTEAAMIGCRSCDMPSGSPFIGGVMLASRKCDASLGTDHPNHQVFGGADVTSTARKWALESSTGTVRATATASGGFDYAEPFENADKKAHPPGSFLSAGPGRSVRLGPGRLRGIQSSNPSVIGGDDGLAWAGRYVRDEFDGVVMNDVEHVRVERRGDPKRKARATLYDGPADGAPEVIDGDTVTRYVVRFPRQSPDYDPRRPQVSRRDRPDEWTLVGLLGQIKGRVAEDVQPGDWLVAGEGGVGVAADAPDPGCRIECMAITSPYDHARGYAVALCLVR